MKLIVNPKSNTHYLNASLVYEFLNKSGKNVSLQLVEGAGNDRVSLELDGGQRIESIQSVNRVLATLENNLLGAASSSDQAQLDGWLDFAQALAQTSSAEAFNELAVVLESSLNDLCDFLVGSRLTVADFAVFAALKTNGLFDSYAQRNTKSSLLRYISSLEKSFLSLGVSFNKQNSRSGEAKDYSKEGKFIDLPGAEKGKVVVRFPPEASGYLHVGHAKAALLNQFYQKEFEGRLIFRFDDTNPAKEDAHFEEVIEEDVRMLGIQWDQFSRTSDYFEQLLVLCEKMIREGKAYADDTDAETMKAEREKKIESKNRNNSVEENLRIWREMVNGTEFGQKYCIRAKLNMQSDNGAMRDPTMYRCKLETHTATGDKYKVYPTYDFACPVVDSLENVTHALRTTEYHDRDDQYFWFLDALNMRKPHIYEYSRFNLQNTVLSKRRLTWFVAEGKVRGWDDPRFPTVRGILRRGMTIEGLKQFIIAQGSSRSVVMMDWDKIWAINKKIIDDIAPRHTTLLRGHTVPVNVSGIDAPEAKQQPKHPKNSDLGTKTVWYGPQILIDEADAVTVKENEFVTFMDWGNLKITKINRTGDKITSIDAQLCLDNKDYKKTLKLTWLTNSPANAPFTPVKCFHFDHIISKAVLDKDEDFKAHCEHKTEFEFDLLGDVEMRNLKKGDIIQISRRGYYICDQAFTPTGSATNGVLDGEPAVLFNIPEGNKNESPTSYMSITNQKYYSAIVGAEQAKLREAAEAAAAAAASKAAPAKPAKTPAQPKPQPQIAATPVVSSSNSSSDELLYEKVRAQGELIRNLKAQKAPKDEVTKEVNQLLSLKEEYKKATGQEWKPRDAAPAAPAPAAPTPAAPSAAATPAAAATPSVGGNNDLYERVKNQGDLIRNLKAQKAPKDQVTKEVNALLALKEEYKKATGEEWKPRA